MAHASRPPIADATELLELPDRERVAAIYSDVIEAAGGRAVDRNARVEILMSLIDDATARKLDPFLSRERALAALDRARRSGEPSDA